MKKFQGMTDVKQQGKNLKIVVGPYKPYKKVSRLKIITKNAITE